MASLKSLQRLKGLKTMFSDGASSVRQNPVGRGLLDSVSALLDIVRVATYYRNGRPHSRFDDLLMEDSEIYGRYYRGTTTAVLPSTQALLGRLEQKFDIVHLICDVTEAGTIRDASGHEITGTELIQRCCDHDVKLLWAASDNPGERYIKGFGARGKRLNLVMTLKRKGPNFPSFLQKMLSRMAYGQTMPVAWNDICPQIPRSEHKDAPESIFFAGRGGVRLLA